MMRSPMAKALDEALVSFMKEVAQLRERQLQKLLDYTGALPRDCHAFQHNGPPLRVQYVAPNSVVSLWEEWTETSVSFRFEGLPE